MYYVENSCSHNTTFTIKETLTPPKGGEEVSKDDEDIENSRGMVFS